MTLTITNEDTGRVFEFATEEEFEAAVDWYNRNSKEAILDFCHARKVDLFESPKTLRDDWAHMAMECFANQ